MALRLRRGTDAERQLITPAQGELIYTTDTKKLYVGDGTTAGGIAVDSTVGSLSLDSLTDVDITTVLPEDGEVLTYDAAAGEWVPGPATNASNINLQDLANVLSVEPLDGEILKYDAINSQWIYSQEADLSGVFRGTIIGDMNGSVFGDDSTVLVDAVNNLITGNISTNNITTPLGGDLDINDVNAVTINKAGFPIVFLNNNQPTADLHAGADLHGLLIFRTTDINGVKNSSLIGSSATGLTIAKSDAALNLPDSHKIHIGTDGNFGFGTLTPTEKFDFIGNGRFSGTLDAASFKGSVVADDSTLLVDAVSGTIPGYVSYEDLRTALALSADYDAFKTYVLTNFV